jgi:hypothetical protein
MTTAAELPSVLVGLSRKTPMEDHGARGTDARRITRYRAVCVSRTRGRMEIRRNYPNRNRR